MSDTTQATASAKRKNVSDRAYLLADGGIAEDIESATGARYSLLGADGNPFKSFDEQLGKAGDFATMCACFGFHTKIGNVANTVLNDKSEPGTLEQAADAIAEFIATAKDGTWAERGGAVGARVDKDKLAGAIVTVAQAGGKTADYQAIRDRLESDPQYVRKARQVPDVATAYAAAVGKPTRTVDDLLS